MSDFSHVSDARVARIRVSCKVADQPGSMDDWIELVEAALVDLDIAANVTYLGGEYVVAGQLTPVEEYEQTPVDEEENDPEPESPLVEDEADAGDTAEAPTDPSMNEEAA